MEKKGTEKSEYHIMKKIFYRIAMVICLVVFCYCGYRLYGIWNEGHQIKKETQQLEQLLKPSNDVTQKDENVLEPDWAALQAQNSQIIGWILVPGTGISFPVVQGTDNSYYLTHTVAGEYNYRGSIFLDYEASPNFTDDNSIIYGHSVDVGGMFTNLKDFEDQSFFEDHPYFWLLTPEQNYRCDIFAFFKQDESAAVYTTGFGDYRDSIIQTMHDQALYWRDVPLEEKRMVSLSTCDLDYGFDSIQRLVLSAVLEPWSEPITATAD